MARSASFSARRRVCALVAVFALVLGFGGIGPAQAADLLPTFKAEARVNDNGTVDVTQTLTFSSLPPTDVVQRIALKRPTGKDATGMYVYTLDKISAEGGAISAATQGEYQVLTVKPSANTVVMKYSVSGATTANSDQTISLRWRIVQGFNIPFEKVETLALIPGNFEEMECHAGVPDSPRVCSLSEGGRDDALMPRFVDGPLGAGEVMDVHIRMDSKATVATGKISHRWSMDRAFSFDSGPLAAAVAVLALGAGLVWWLRRRAGQDAASARPTRIAEFAPVGEGHQKFVVLDNVRPGEAGTLSDEIVNPVDITATIVDLAVRGHMRITELERTGAHQPLDWLLERRDGSKDLQELLAYEQSLLDVVVPEGVPVRVGEITAKVGEAVADVQDKLYDEMVTRGWYARRPDSTRHSARLAAIIALVLAGITAGVLIALTSYGLAGLIVAGTALIVLLGVVPDLPARTAQGASVLAGLHLLASQLQAEPTNRMPEGAEYDELSQVLPYTIVLGGRDRWVQAIADADDDSLPDPQDLHWYHAPSTWTMSDFPTSIDAFLTTLTGKLFHRG